VFILNSKQGANTFCSKVLLTSAARLASGAVHAENISIWVKALIPSSGSAVTKDVPGHPGQTMLNGGSPGCFLTDQRGFNNGPTSSARITSSITFNLSAAGVTGLSDSHKTGVTQTSYRTLGKPDGLCTGQAENLGMEFQDVAFDSTQNDSIYDARRSRIQPVP
jgi:hypothetical protein